MLHAKLFISNTSSATKTLKGLSAFQVQAAMEMRAGSKKTVLLADGIFYMDSRDAAERFKKAFAHVITLCGGKRAPF